MTNTKVKDGEIAFIRGEASYAKVLGPPVPNYEKDGKEWVLDVALVSKEAVDQIQGLGLGSKVKNKATYLDGTPYITFRQPELRKDGTPNRPIEIVDSNGRAWDSTALIGNGSVIDVKFQVKDYGAKPAGMYIRKIRVMKHVPYVIQDDFPPVDEDDEFFNKSGANEDWSSDDLDDEVPV